MPHLVSPQTTPVQADSARAAAVVDAVAARLETVFGLSLTQVRSHASGSRTIRVRECRFAYIYTLSRLAFHPCDVMRVLDRDHASVSSGLDRIRTEDPSTTKIAADLPRLCDRLAEHCEPIVRAVRTATGWNQQADPFGNAEHWVLGPQVHFRQLAESHTIPAQVAEQTLAYAAVLETTRPGRATAARLLGLRHLATQPKLRALLRQAYTEAGTWQPRYEAQILLQARQLGCQVVA